ncbi:MAG: hypothetical protein JJT94_09200 [Bernardetiaceae bacterium]|nr:hypothetical protein [Bernardetiaceae bacterium]
MNYRVRNQISSLDALFETADKISDEELQAHFAKYLCVKTSGLFENYMKAQVGDYVDVSSARPTANFVKNKTKSFTNINYQKLASFLNAFDNSWGRKFEEMLTPELKSSLNAVIANRNNIAHGIPDSISLGSMKIHYENMKKIITIIDSIIKK